MRQGIPITLVRALGPRSARNGSNRRISPCIRHESQFRTNPRIPCTHADSSRSSRIQASALQAGGHWFGSRYRPSLYCLLRRGTLTQCSPRIRNLGLPRELRDQLRERPMFECRLLVSVCFVGGLRQPGDVLAYCLIVGESLALGEPCQQGLVDRQVAGGFLGVRSAGTALPQPAFEVVAKVGEGVDQERF